MIKKVFPIILISAVLGVLIFGAVNRTYAKTINDNVGQAGNGFQGGAAAAVQPADSGDALGVGEYGRRQGGNGSGGVGVQSGSSLPAAGELSAEESAALLYMREEEKLAHDVYAALYAKWNLPLFQNISQSEQAHTDAIKALLDRYALSDPASSNLGVFTDPKLQALYTDLVARGSQSLAEAIKVGAAIEEIDILDLQEDLAQTDNADIQQVFNNLLNGSYNHLRSFVSTLNTQAGETYQPQYLSAEAYQTILASAGRGGGSGQGNGGGGRGGNSTGGRSGRP